MALAPSDFYYLTRADRDRLRAALAAEAQQVHHTAQDPPPDAPQPAPSVHVVRPTSAAGIPARQGVTAGRAACAVYKVARVGSDYLLVPVLLPSGNPQTVQVCNISTKAVAQEYRVARRDRYGTWVVEVCKCVCGSDSSHSSSDSSSHSQSDSQSDSDSGSSDSSDSSDSSSNSLCWDSVAEEWVDCDTGCTDPNTGEQVVGPCYCPEGGRPGPGEGPCDAPCWYTNTWGDPFYRSCGYYDEGGTFVGCPSGGSGTGREVTCH